VASRIPAAAGPVSPSTAFIEQFLLTTVGFWWLEFSPLDNNPCILVGNMAEGVDVSPCTSTEACQVTKPPVPPRRRRRVAAPSGEGGDSSVLGDVSCTLALLGTGLERRLTLGGAEARSGAPPPLTPVGGSSQSLNRRRGSGSSISAASGATGGQPLPPMPRRNSQHTPYVSACVNVMAPAALVVNGGRRRPCAAPRRRNQLKQPQPPPTPVSASSSVPSVLYILFFLLRGRL